MSINIREILTTDSDIIKVDKTNYNFDQIVANGGGPIGLKGQKGEFGSTGNTGSKGQKGEQGVKGEVGPSGQDLNNWSRMDYDATTDTSILKPKKDSDDQEPSSVVLGDDGVNFVDPSAWLNIFNPSGSNFYSNYISLLNSGTSVLNFSSITSNSTDTYKITHGISANDVDFEIDIKNNILVKANEDLALEAGGNININAGNNDTFIGPNNFISSGQLDIRYSDVTTRGNLTVDSTGYVKLPSGTIAQRPTGGLGMLRYSSNRNIGFNGTQGSIEAFVPHPAGSYWKVIDGLVDADGDTFIKPDYNTNTGQENVITISIGSSQTAVDVVGTIGDNVDDGSTTLEKTFTYNRVIHAKDDILVDNDLGSKAPGLRIKKNTTQPGSSQVAAQNNSASAGRENRTLADYFYRKSALQYNTLSFSGNTPFTDSQISIDSSVYRYTGDAIIAQSFVSDVEDLEAKKVGVIFDHTTSKMSYIKVGHMVTVWGRLDYFPFAIDWNNLGFLPTEGVNFEGQAVTGNTITKPSRRAAFTIGRPEDFPYHSDLEDNRVVFPISISVQAQDGPSGQLNSRYYGVIQPGTNVFNIMKVDDSTGFISGKVIEDDSNDHYGKFLNIDDLKAQSASPADVITLEYNFSMPTGVNSYDLGSSSVNDYQEDGTPQANIQGGG